MARKEMRVGAREVSLEWNLRNGRAPKIGPLNITPSAQRF